MDTIKSGWSSLKRTVRSKVNGPQQEEDYFSESWFDKLVGGEDQSCFSYFKLPFKVRISIICILVFFGIISLFLSFTFILLPMKFAKLFTVGNVLILLSTFFLRSISSQIKSLISDIPKLVAFILYLISIALVLFCALKLKSTMLTLPCVVLEVVALLWYLFSYLPYGQEMLKTCFSGCWSCCVHSN
ncbi:vesicle transport protein SFT2B, putative [Entamoeba dispar SAW760]|uniref:Vesicle transport protein n=1 Tax=Entamoeba dispar (strain ATCC PRA-260 / SAW760) TaxID=370354 RepID=B0E9D7_ENTDS|nr:vesicle transport protein SFT2B, putative [Entamoeba dispar SAW760]EDR28846.1 vesicle transport protein SFT2B, putative [Entamoeba dispar SAW760]|eukprot:EDR28846.1 vesicle transport protein SFT2B, putative [Entamoeba dispar SAW760]